MALVAAKALHVARHVHRLLRGLFTLFTISYAMATQWRSILVNSLPTVFYQDLGDSIDDLRW
jgi:hypothetical protein